VPSNGVRVPTPVDSDAWLRHVRGRPMDEPPPPDRFPTIYQSCVGRAGGLKAGGPEPVRSDVGRALRPDAGQVGSDRVRLEGPT
jgi:hypothetical protein